MSLTTQQKADAWGLAAMHLEAIYQDKQNEGFASDDPDLWQHIAHSVIPSLRQRGAIVGRRVTHASRRGER